MIQEYTTDFEFKGERQYVHSTTLIEAVVSIVDTHFFPQEDWFLPRLDGQFHQEITTNGILRFAREGKLLEGEGPVPARLKFYDRGESISVIFHENRGEVQQRIDPVYGVDELTLEAEYTGNCIIDGSYRMAFVENIIEANKRLHVMTLQQGRGDLKVVNLYVKGLPVFLPSIRGLDTGRLRLHIQNRSIRPRADSVVTLNSLHFPETDMDPFEMCFVVYGL